MDAVVAVYSDWGIGEGGTQPVTVPEDRKHFAAVTKGAAVIVGRRTLADFPGGRPLKGRVNIVLTRQDVEIEGAVVVHSVAEALAEAGKHEKVFVIGGERVFSAFYPHLNRIYVTKIEFCPHSDVFFKNLDTEADWLCTQEGPAMEHEGVRYRFCVYERQRHD
jgi:dihydrofolate reductase